MDVITNIFTEAGGRFMHTEDVMKQKLQNIRAFVFDWDGVFTDGSKDQNMQSSFNEVDSMGINLLRFSYHTRHHELPVCAIISGEKNQAAFNFAERECFHASYARAANKVEAAEHLCKTYHLKLNQIAFIFDDVLDLSLAEHCGLRFFIPRRHNPMFNHYVESHHLADYITAATSGQYAIREAAELVISLQSDFAHIVHERVINSDAYQKYLGEKKSIRPRYYAFHNGELIETIEKQ